jgi:uncharacterized membrane protein
MSTQSLRFGSPVGVNVAGTSEASGVEWLLKRNCSISPTALLGFYVSLSVVSLGIAAFFWAQGAPLVLPFAFAELLTVGICLLVYARHAADREYIALRGDRLTVQVRNGSRVQEAEFAPHRVRIEPAAVDGSLIELSGQGRRVAVGRFVRPELRRALAAELRQALKRGHPGAPPPMVLS